MLETIREFSAVRRSAAGESERVLDRFLEWAREFGMAHHGSLLGAEPFLAAERVRAEQDNLVSALRHGLARADAATVGASAAVLAGLWTFEARYARMMALADRVGWLLSHFRPGPDLLGVTRTAVTLCTGNILMLASPRADRLLVTLRRLPPGDPGTVAGALAIVLAAVPIGPPQSWTTGVASRRSSDSNSASSRSPFRLSWYKSGSSGLSERPKPR